MLHLLFELAPNKELVLFFFPLTPKIALLSTKFIVSKNKYIRVSNEFTIAQLNLLSYQNAHEHIYSTKENPFSEEVKKAIVNHKIECEKDIYSCQIYTTKNRYKFSLNKYHDIKIDNYFMNGLKLYFKDKNNVQELLKDKYLELITVNTKNGESQSMSDLEIGKYDEKLNTLEVYPKFKFHHN